MSMTEASTDRLVVALQKMVFYDQRFAKHLSGLYPDVSVSRAPYSFISTLVERIPHDQRFNAVSVALQKIINSYDHCPSPKEVRLALAEGAIQACCKITFKQQMERARSFLAFPPQTIKEAQSWENQILFSAIKSLSRERFMSVDEPEWVAAVADVIFGNRPLVTYQPESDSRPAATSRPFVELLRKRDQ